jgi:glycine/D-amino acid oxidase-like deaminating enzyme
VKSWDAIVVGAGIIGLSLAIELNKQGLRVLVVEKGEPGREASWAAGGMLADFPLETPLGLRELAAASARMYPEFVRELEDESGVKIDLRSVGTIVLTRVETGKSPATTQAYLLPRPLAELEPALRISNGTPRLTPMFVNERCVDPRDLTTAAIAASRRRGIDFSSGGADRIAPSPDAARQRANAVRRHAAERTGAPCHTHARRLLDPAQRRADADRGDRGRSGIRQANGAGDDPEIAAGGD